MSSDAHRNSSTSSARLLPKQVKEAVASYQHARIASTEDTRLASQAETENISIAPVVHKLGSRRRSKRPQVRTINRGRSAPTFRGNTSQSHTRQDLTTGNWTIFAPERDSRPNEYAPLEQLQRSIVRANEQVDPGCPFCQGSECMTPEAVWSARLTDTDESSPPLGVDSNNRFAPPAVSIVHGDQAAWDVRIVPNKFPAVSRSSGGPRTYNDSDGLFPIADVVGGHEVMIESSDHVETVAHFDPALVYVSLLAYQDRIRHWRHVPGINYISVFKNCGPEAGASLRHSHSQLIATSLMPEHIRNVLAKCELHRARTGAALGCDLMRAELAERSRVIDQTDSLIAFCPFASPFAGMIRISSIAHQPYFDALSHGSLDQLASFLWRVLTWLEGAFPGKAFNYLLHTYPPGGSQPDSFQWSLDLFPRLSKVAGFEWSSNCMINSILPEVAARNYREVAKKDDPRCLLSRS